MIPDWIDRETLHSIRKYFIEGGSPKGFLEDENSELETDEVQAVLDWFNDVVADAIDNN